MIPLCIPNVGLAERELLFRCIDEGFVSSVGPFVAEFEEALAAATGAAGAVTTGSGTQALRLALHLAGVRPGDLVVMPSFTFIATANAAWQAGARPYLLDVEPEGWTLDPNALESFIREQCSRRTGELIHLASGARIGAVVPVYTMGRAAKMTRLRSLSHDAGVPIIADAAAALGTTSSEGPLSELADLSCLSFNGNKIVTSGCGGAIVACDENVLARGRLLASTARVGADYNHIEPAFNYRMSNMDAAVGVAQLRRLDDFVAAKRRIRSAYDEALRDHPFAEAWSEPEWTHSNRWFSGFVAKASGSQAAKTMLSLLNQSGVGARPFWKPIHLQPMYTNALRSALPISEDLWERIVTLPCSTGITDEELAFCVAAVGGLADSTENLEAF